jgi:thiamine-monophosphate kinase
MKLAAAPRLLLCNPPKSGIIYPRMGTRGEFDLIAWIRNRQEQPSDLVPCGIGDDCAVFQLPAGQEAVITTDMLVEGVDFRPEWMPPWFLGSKSLAVCLSDLAAMGASPIACLLSLALPSKLTGSFFEQLIDGFLDGCRRWNAPLVGGDLSGGPVVVVSVSAVGAVPTGRAVLRSGATPGDRIVVFGDLGLAGQGLEILEQERPNLADRISTPAALEQWAQTPERYAALKAHLLPEPLLDCGRWLREAGLISAMIDVSDGLAADLRHLIRASQVAAEIDLGKAGVAQKGPRPDNRMILNGGEDYALVATVGDEQVERLLRDYPSSLPAVRVLGRIVPGPPVVYVVEGDTRREYKPEGFEHFR